MFVVFLSRWELLGGMGGGEGKGKGRFRKGFPLVSGVGVSGEAGHLLHTWGKVGGGWGGGRTI